MLLPSAIVEQLSPDDHVSAKEEDLKTEGTGLSI